MGHFLDDRAWTRGETWAAAGWPAWSPGRELVAVGRQVVELRSFELIRELGSEELPASWVELAALRDALLVG